MARDKELTAVQYCGRWSQCVNQVSYYSVPVCLLLGVILCSLPSTHAAMDNWDVDGVNGMLYVHGALVESPCRLEMDSARQDVDLGIIGTAQLQNTGDRGEPVRVELRLADCVHSSSGSHDSWTDNLTWANDQPVVSVSFQATKDTDNPELIKAQGVSGLGLHLEDGQGRDVHLGSRGTPLMLIPGQNALTYVITPERTPADLSTGSYRAMVDFHMSYD